MKRPALYWFLTTKLAYMGNNDLLENANIFLKPNGRKDQNTRQLLALSLWLRFTLRHWVPSHSTGHKLCVQEILSLWLCKYTPEHSLKGKVAAPENCWPISTSSGYYVNKEKVASPTRAWLTLPVFRESSPPRPFLLTIPSSPILHSMPCWPRNIFQSIFHICL